MSISDWSSDVCSSYLMDKFQVAIHAIGDAANAEALAAIADLTADLATDVPGERRWRIEHAQIIDPADIARFAELKVIASMQPVHQPSDRVKIGRHTSELQSLIRISYAVFCLKKKI